jgi:hypothetical protein
MQLQRNQQIVLKPGLARLAEKLDVKDEGYESLTNTIPIIDRINITSVVIDIFA